MDLEKIIFACRALDQIGHAVAFSLNLSPFVAARASSNPDWLRRAILRHVGSDVPLLIAYGCADGRLHIHGALAAKPELQGAIMAALETAAGPWASRRGEAYQLVFRPMHDSDGWARYLVRNIAEAKQIDRDRSWWSMTNSARRAAKQLHAATREAVNLYTPSLSAPKVEKRKERQNAQD